MVVKNSTDSCRRAMKARRQSGLLLQDRTQQFSPSHNPVRLPIETQDPKGTQIILSQFARLQLYCLTNSMGPSPLGGCGIGGHNKLPLVVRPFSGMLCPSAPMQSKRHCLVAPQHPEPNQLRGSTACHSCEWHAVSPLVHETTEPHSGS